MFSVVYEEPIARAGHRYPHSMFGARNTAPVTVPVAMQRWQDPYPMYGLCTGITATFRTLGRLKKKNLLWLYHQRVTWAPEGQQLHDSLSGFGNRK
jgi:hypothetical protein